MNKESISKITRKLGLSVSHQWKSWMMMRCPFAEWTHAKGTDRNASFGIRINEEGLSGYHCFTCKQKGRVSGLIRALAHYREEDYTELAMEADLLEASGDLKPFENLFDTDKTDKPVPLDEAIFEGMYLDAWEDEPTRDYLQSERGISEETSKLLGLLSDPDEDRVLFPVRGLKGELYGFSGRSILTDVEWTDRYPRIKDYAGMKKEMQLLGADKIDPNKPTALVEGLFAYAHFVEIGAREVLNPVASLGSFLSKYQASLLGEVGMPVYLFYDPDTAGDIGIYGRLDKKTGEHLGDGAADRLKKQLPTFVPMYPEGVTDPDNLTFENLEEMFEEAEFYS